MYTSGSTSTSTLTLSPRILVVPEKRPLTQLNKLACYQYDYYRSGSDFSAANLDLSGISDMSPPRTAAFGRGVPTGVC